MEPAYRSFLDVADCPSPTNATINGPAVGAGLTLRWRAICGFSAERAWLDTRFLAIGPNPGEGHGSTLSSAVGRAQTSRMSLAGARISAAGALAFDSGLIPRRVVDDAVLAEAVTMAKGAASLPRDLLLRTKNSLRRAESSSPAMAVQHGAAEQARSLRQLPCRDLVSRLRASIAER